MQLSFVDSSKWKLHQLIPTVKTSKQKIAVPACVIQMRKSAGHKCSSYIAKAHFPFQLVNLLKMRCVWMNHLNGQKFDWEAVCYGNRIYIIIMLDLNHLNKMEKWDMLRVVNYAPPSLKYKIFSEAIGGMGLEKWQNENLRGFVYFICAHFCLNSRTSK